MLGYESNETIEKFIKENIGIEKNSYYQVKIINKIKNADYFWFIGTYIW